MTFFFVLFQRGGIFMWPIALGSLLAVALAAVRLVWSRSPDWEKAEQALVILVLACGFTGTFEGMRIAFRAVAHAHPETQAAMIMAGLSVALVTIVSAAFGAGALVALQSFTQSRRPRQDAAAGLSWLNATALVATLIALGAGVHAIATTLHGSANYGLQSIPTQEVGLFADRLGSAPPVTAERFGFVEAVPALPPLPPEAIALQSTAATWLDVSILVGALAMFLSLISVLMGLFKGLRSLEIRVTFEPNTA